jgi:hypothetical protein
MKGPIAVMLAISFSTDHADDAIRCKLEKHESFQI